MATIEQRVAECMELLTNQYRSFTLPTINNTIKQSLTDITTEQKYIAIKAFDETCGWLSTYPWYQEVRDEFIKALDR